MLYQYNVILVLWRYSSSSKLMVWIFTYFSFKNNIKRGYVHQVQLRNHLITQDVIQLRNRLGWTMNCMLHILSAEYMWISKHVFKTKEIVEWLNYTAFTNDQNSYSILSYTAQAWQNVKQLKQKTNSQVPATTIIEKQICMSSGCLDLIQWREVRWNTI